MRKVTAAFMAALSVFILFGGCGGGGSKPPVDVPTVITGTVENEANQAVNRAKVFCEGLTAETNSAGLFTINPIGQGVKTLTISKGGYEALQVPVDLNQTKVDIKLLRLLIPTKETMDEVAAPANWPVYFTKKFGSKDLLPNFLRFTPEGGVELKLYVAGALDLPENNGRPYAWAHIEGRYTVDLFFYDVVYGGNTTNLVLTGTVVFVIPTDNIKPVVTLDPIAGTVKGTINIKGTAKDLDEQGRGVSSAYVIDLDNPTKSKGLTRDFAGYHIEGPPSGIKLVLLRYSGQDHPITPDASGSFQSAVDTLSIPDGPITFEVSAIDNAGNPSEVKSLTTTVDNIPDPKPDPWDEMDTIDKQLVMVDEPARSFDSSTWPQGNYGYTNVQAVAFKSNGSMLVYAAQVLEYLFGQTVPQLYPEGGVWGGGGGIATSPINDELYICGYQSFTVWRFSPDGHLINLANNIHRSIHGPELVQVDRQGYVWVKFTQNSGIACYNPDLSEVMVRNSQGDLKPLIVDIGVNTLQTFAADKKLDTLVYADSFIDPQDNRWKGRMIRRRISTGENSVLMTYPEVFGSGGIEIDPIHGQVAAEISFGPQSYLIQFGKKADGQWGELHRSHALNGVQWLVRGASFNEYYTIHGDWKARRWVFQQ